MSIVQGQFKMRLEVMDIEEILECVQNKAVRSKFIRLFKYMMKDGHEYYGIVHVTEDVKRGNDDEEENRDESRLG